MSRPFDTAVDRDTLLAEWAAEIAARLERGEAENLSEFATRSPDLAAELRELLPAIRMMTRLPAENAVKPSLLGDFQIVREIGRGGMGIVYEAVQVSLNRRVALKVLPVAATLDGRRLQRFHLEARAAACLQHSNIVPVYSVGTAGEVPYFAMQFVDGRSLAEILHVLRQREGIAEPAEVEALEHQAEIDPTTETLAFGLTGAPLAPACATAPSPPQIPRRRQSERVTSILGNSRYVRTIVGLAIQAAHALDYAHTHEIIHRDVKPGNLLLDSHGHLWVADFGVARMLGDARFTLSGDLLGTLRYMSPEQALEKRVVLDGRTDVYSLGVTLYELLTLRPAMGGSDRVELLRKLAHEEPAPPRVLNPAISRDLETILRKAMAKAPGDRYATARDLAADLGRFLEGKPVAARRPGPVQRLARLASRHRPVVIATSLLVALGLLGTAIALVGSNLWLRQHSDRLRQEKNRADQFAREADQHRRIADQQRELADQRLYDSQIRQAADSLEAHQPERAQEILRELEPRPGEADLREFAWHELWRRSRRDVAIVTGRNERAYVLALSADGKTLAVGDADGTIRLRDPATGAVRATLSGHQYEIEWLSFSGDGRLLASTSQPENSDLAGELHIWDAVRGTLLARFDPHGSGRFYEVRFHPSGRYLWETSQLPGDSTRMAGIWDLGPDPTRPRPQLVRRWPTWQVISTVSDTLRIVTTDPQNGVVVANALTGMVSRVAAKGSAGFTGAGISRNGRLVAASNPDTHALITWSVSSGKIIDQFRTDSEGSGHVFHFSEDGSFLVACDNLGVTLVRNLRTHRVLTLSHDPRDQEQQFFAWVTIAPDNRRVAWSYAGLRSGPWPITIFDMATGQTLATYPGRNDRTGTPQFLPDGHSLLFDGRDDIVRWYFDPRPELPQRVGHAVEAWAAAFTPDGRQLATGSDDTHETQTLKIWDVATGALVRGWKPHEATVSAVAYTPDGRVLATASLGPDANLRLWDPTTATLLADLPGHTDRVRTLGFSPDGRLLASAGSDRKIRIWNVATRTLVKVLEGHKDTVRQVCFHPDGKRLASASNDRSLRIWDVEQGIELHAWRGLKKIAAAAFAPDGHSLASGDTDGMLTIRDFDGGNIQRVIHVDDEELLCLAYAPDGRTLASSCRGRRIRLWDPRTGQELSTLDDSKSQINALLFSPDRSILVACHHDGTVRLWRGTDPDRPAPADNPEKRVVTTNAPPLERRAPAP